MDVNKLSAIVGFVTIEDPQLKTIDTINGKVQFVELVGATYNELDKILSKEVPAKEVIDKIISRYSDLTDYTRPSIYYKKEKGFPFFYLLSIRLLFDKKMKRL